MLKIIYIYIYIYKKQDSRTFNKTIHIYKHINQYSTDVFNSYKINKTHIVKKTYHNSNTDGFINQHKTINTNDTYTSSNNNSLYSVNDNNYHTRKSFNTSSITNSITRHNHNNNEHNVIKQVHKHMTHIGNYDTDVNCYNKIT